MGLNFRFSITPIDNKASFKLSDQVYQACELCDNEGTVKVGANDSMTCPACNGLGLVLHNCK